MKRRSKNKGELASNLASLPNLDRASLVEQWQIYYKTKPPVGISRQLLIRVIAYRMQELILGGLKPATKRYLEKAVKDVAVSKQITNAPPKLKPGTKLLREWHGVTHEVTILENGMYYQGKTYQSLSVIACLITGTRWSGPAFFGLKRRGSS